jgi:phospholipid transport system substrate-binding protein
VSVFVALVLLGSAAAAQANSPNVLVEEAVNELSAKLDGRKAELAEDRESLYDLIDDVLLPRFDRKLAAQLVLAQHWRTASAEQQERFIDAFYQNLLHKYADGVLEFDESQVEILPFRGDTTKRRTQVKTIVRLDDGTRVPVDYDLVKSGDRWMMFNVTVEGVSYVRNYRAELDEEIRKTSLDAVIERLESEAQPSAAPASSE